MNSDPRITAIIRAGIAIGIALLSFFIGRISMQNPASIPVQKETAIAKEKHAPILFPSPIKINY